MSRVGMETPAMEAAIREQATPLKGSDRDYDVLLEMARDKQFVLLGEASHGTHEFYAMRAAITRRLIEELDFDAVIVEGDWPNVYRINRFVRGTSNDTTARESLGDFERFPRWMWRNRDVENFVAWLREYNAERDANRQSGMYGLDLYSLHDSAAAVVAYLDGVDPEAAKRARERYACLDHGGDPQAYGYSVSMGVTQSCQDEAAVQLMDLLRSRTQRLEADGLATEDEQFFAEMNARVVKNAEEYYRSMFGTRVSTWNLRDRHMAESLFELHLHLSEQRGRPAKIAVWAHNSHLGDARATQVSRYGELNLGQLVRERTGDDCLLVGFTTYTGYVTAARDWDAPAEHRRVQPALDDSIENLFENTGLENFFLPLRDADGLPERALERAIGVIYRPESERQSHYFHVSLAKQFDAVFHLDETTALEPLDIGGTWTRGDLPETWPTGI
ncbi:MAG TPA: erythromycin esterase family protein [Gammaproteobacteria bacterium]